MTQLCITYMRVCVCAQSCPTLMTLWTAACQTPLSMEFSRAEFWGGLPFPFPGGFPDPEIEPASPELAAGFFTTVPPGKPISIYMCVCVCVCVCVCIFFFFFRLFSLIGYYKISRSLFVDFFLIPEMSLNQAPYSCRDSPASSLLLIPLLAWPSNWFVCHLQTLSMDPAPATGVFREPLCMVVSPLCSQISGPSLGLRIPQSIELVSRLEPALPHE